MNKNRFDIKSFGENGWIATIHDDADLVADALFVNTVAKTLRTKPGIIDAVAGIDSVTMRYAPSALSNDAAQITLVEAIENTPTDFSEPTTTIEIPICYGTEYGPDTEEIANTLGLEKGELIKLHAASAYRVLAVGFAPGFAYLGPTDETLHCNRRDTPRPQVAAGSVGIAGNMTGIYPLPSPGGWHIIGRTPIPLFDPLAEEPFIFHSGAEVRFREITEDEFGALSEASR
ncbi:5-oxoprolinase subunit PxpB [Hyphococcus sp. DH-69]|uniref:5-oxoprolinase subunit PxpB n=1 Tax=Hyphococcus formosus TaxID=3143534 RepID=UPI00398A889B